MNDDSTRDRAILAFGYVAAAIVAGLMLVGVSVALSDNRPEVEVYGFSGCPPCEAWKTDKASGRLNGVKWVYQSIDGESGKRAYEAAMRRPGPKEEGFPAFFVGGHQRVNYATNDGLIEWVRRVSR